MTTKKHTKHTELVKPAGGRFGSNEMAFIGAPCGHIQSLYEKLYQNLHQKLNLAYVDADHKEADSGETQRFDTIYTDQIGSHLLQFPSDHIDYEFRSLLRHADLTIINGNHFIADKQGVIINSKKKESLERKLDRLTNIRMIILDEGETEVYDFIKEHLPSYGSLPVFKIKDIDAIADFLIRECNGNRPNLNGLVLAGGKSTRMGKDKTQLVYYEKPQTEHVADLLSEFCDEVFISTAEEKCKKIASYPVLPDTFTGLGPFGGILSAFRHNPDSAWFTIASDIPLISRKSLGEIVKKRNTSRLATCLQNEETGFPEPLITIWEPRAYERMLYFLSLGYSCPRKVLINSNVEILRLENQKEIFNVNTPEELEKAKQFIAGHQ